MFGQLLSPRISSRSPKMPADRVPSWQTPIYHPRHYFVANEWSRVRIIVLMVSPAVRAAPPVLVNKFAHEIVKRGCRSTVLPRVTSKWPLNGVNHTSARLKNSLPSTNVPKHLPEIARRCLDLGSGSFLSKRFQYGPTLQM